MTRPHAVALPDYVTPESPGTNRSVATRGAETPHAPKRHATGSCPAVYRVAIGQPLNANERRDRAQQPAGR